MLAVLAGFRKSAYLVFVFQRKLYTKTQLYIYFLKTISLIKKLRKSI